MILKGYGYQIYHLFQIVIWLKWTLRWNILVILDPSKIRFAMFCPLRCQEFVVPLTASTCWISAWHVIAPGLKKSRAEALRSNGFQLRRYHLGGGGTSVVFEREEGSSLKMFILGGGILSAKVIKYRSIIYIISNVASIKWKDVRHCISVCQGYLDLGYCSIPWFPQEDDFMIFGRGRLTALRKDWQPSTSSLISRHWLAGPTSAPSFS